MSGYSCYHIAKPGNFKRLKKLSLSLEAPADHEVQVEVRAIGLNFADLFAILGLYSATPKDGFIPGLEYSGVITAMGKNVPGLKTGDRVMGVTRFGGYTTALNIDANYVVPLPDEWDYNEGAAFLVQALTAYYGLFSLGNLQKGQTVLIHSGAGGVGIQANRMAQRSGAYTIGTTGSPSKTDILKQEGFDDFIVRDKHFAENLQKALGDRRLDLVMECIGGTILKAGFRSLAPQGRMVVYGSAQYGSDSDKPNWLKLIWLYLQRPRIDVQKLIETNRSILGFNLIWLYEREDLMKEVLEGLDDLKLPPPLVGHIFSFDSLPEALQLFRSGKTVGKVIIECP